MNSQSSDSKLTPVDLGQAIIQPVWHKEPVLLDILRLDRIHPVISGNKWFKLHKYLDEVSQRRLRGVITAGGAYSNHIVATAAACRWKGLQAVGIIRGEEPVLWSPTLLAAKELGMILHFATRQDFHDKDRMRSVFEASYPDLLWIDEGGKGEMGVQGAAAIGQVYDLQPYQYIFCAVGTGTMMAGLARSANPGQLICGIPVLKIADLMSSDLVKYIQHFSGDGALHFFDGFHEGGYARKNDNLIAFMNRWYDEYGVESDFVYTPKLFRAIETLAANGYFPRGARVLAIHSGGLQGNRSLPPGSLHF